MEYTILVIEEAENELDESFIWYETQKIGLWDEFIQYIQISFDFIKNHPESSEKKKKNIYRHLMNKFPFGIYYTIEKEVNQIQIISILHFKRNPKIWRKRLKK